MSSNKTLKEEISELKEAWKEFKIVIIKELATNTFTRVLFVIWFIGLIIIILFVSE